MSVFGKISMLMMLFTVTAAVSAQSVGDQKPDSTAVTTSNNSKEVVITQPEFKGGIKEMYQYIADNFQYPEEAARRSVNGKMEVEFTVEKSGDVTYCGIVKGLDYSIDGEILRLLEAMPRWIPATRNGEPVRYKVLMPLTIRAKKSQKSSMSLIDYMDE
ncbi:MAG: energy transducer TonB [Bacteroidaceae bacterium]|nr:energy transducer TonB [Candidatus Colenecus caballi]MCQ2073199.1 energy transducer TonB [Bacteroidaceae bacterium]